MTVRLSIDRVVLDGVEVTYQDIPTVRAALEAELARLLDDSTLAPRLRCGGAMPYLRGGQMTLPASPAPTALARAIALAAWAAIGARPPANRPTTRAGSGALDE